MFQLFEWLAMQYMFKENNMCKLNNNVWRILLFHSLGHTFRAMKQWKILSETWQKKTMCSYHSTNLFTFVPIRIFFLLLNDWLSKQKMDSYEIGRTCTHKYVFTITTIKKNNLFERMIYSYRTIRTDTSLRYVFFIKRVVHEKSSLMIWSITIMSWGMTTKDDW